MSTESVVNTNDRIGILRILLTRETALLVNIYEPNQDYELVTFFCSLFQTVVKKIGKIENIM